MSTETWIVGETCYVVRHNRTGCVITPATVKAVLKAGIKVILEDGTVYKFDDQGNIDDGMMVPAPSRRFFVVRNEP
jgi:hypothetical protein